MSVFFITAFGLDNTLGWVSSLFCFCLFVCCSQAVIAARAAAPGASSPTNKESKHQKLNKPDAETEMKLPIRFIVVFGLLEPVE